MPTKERYERDKAYYTEWNHSPCGRKAGRRKYLKRLEEGRCAHCGAQFEKHLGKHQISCITCLEKDQILSSFYRGGF